MIKINYALPKYQKTHPTLWRNAADKFAEDGLNGAFGMDLYPRLRNKKPRYVPGEGTSPTPLEGALRRTTDGTIYQRFSDGSLRIVRPSDREIAREQRRIDRAQREQEELTALEEKNLELFGCAAAADMFQEMDRQDGGYEL